MTGQSQRGTLSLTFARLPEAATVQAGLQVVDVDAAAGRANHSEVPAGGDVDSLVTGSERRRSEGTGSRANRKREELPRRRTPC